MRLAAASAAVRAKRGRVAELRAALGAESARSSRARAGPALIAAGAAIAEQVAEDQAQQQGEDQQPEQPVKEEESWKEPWDAKDVHGDLPWRSGPWRGIRSSFQETKAARHWFGQEREKEKASQRRLEEDSEEESAAKPSNRLIRWRVRLTRLALGHIVSEFWMKLS